jgi:hypothetical protein
MKLTARPNIWLQRWLGTKSDILNTDMHLQPPHIPVMSSTCQMLFPQAYPYAASANVFYHTHQTKKPPDYSGGFYHARYRSRTQ